MAAEPEVIKTVEEDRGLETQPSPAMSSELSSQEAEANLAEDLAERLSNDWVLGSCRWVSVPPSTPVGVVRQAIRQFEERYAGRGIGVGFDWNNLRFVFKL